MKICVDKSMFVARNECYWTLLCLRGRCLIFSSKLHRPECKTKKGKKMSFVRNRRRVNDCDLRWGCVKNHNRKMASFPALIRESLPREGGRARKSQPSTTWFIKTLRFLASHRPCRTEATSQYPLLLSWADTDTCMWRHCHLSKCAPELLAIRGVTYRSWGWIDGFADNR